MCIFGQMRDFCSSVSPNFIDKRKVFELFIIMHKMTLNSIALGHVVEYDLCTCHNEAMLAYAIIKKNKC